MNAQAPQLILASRSPRRVQLLADAGYRFVAEPADIDEENFPQILSPHEVAEHLAHEKAVVVARRFPNDIILAADTVVALGQSLLGKPEDTAHARWMLGQLSGTTHRVITGVCVLDPSVARREIGHMVSTVSMRPLSPEEIDHYVASGDWRGKAGGYGIQDHDPFVTNQQGSYTNIVGLPMELARKLLERAGVVPEITPG